MAQYATFDSLGNAGEDEVPRGMRGQRVSQNLQGMPQAVEPRQAGSACFEITSAADKQSFVSSNKVVVVNISAEWCAPCQSVKPKFAQLASRYMSPGMCGFAKENADDHITPDVTAVPMFEFYLNGQRVDKYNGASIEQVEQRLTRLLGI